MNSIAKVYFLGCICIAMQCKRPTRIDVKTINSISVINCTDNSRANVVVERKKIDEFISILNGGKAESLKFASHYFVDLKSDTGVVHVALNGDAVSINGIKYRLNCNLERWLDKNVMVK